MTYFQRTIYCNKQLSRPYRYKNILQIFPSEGNVILEYDYDFFLKLHSRSYDRNHHLVNFVHNEVFSRELLHYLTVATDGLFFIRSTETPRRRYPEVSKQIDRLTNLSENIEPKLQQENFLELDPRWQELFDNIFDMNKESLKVLKSAIHWYYSGSLISWEVDDYNSEFISFVNSIEALCKLEYAGEPEKCDECKQPRYRVTKKFVDFLLKYSGDDRTKRNQKELYKEIYGKRSGLVHNGELFIPGIELFINTSDLESVSLLSELQTLSRKSIVNFTHSFKPS